MGFAPSANDDDVQLTLTGLPVVINRNCLAAMNNMEIGLGERDGKKGFVFNGPLFERRQKIENT